MQVVEINRCANGLMISNDFYPGISGLPFFLRVLKGYSDVLRT